MIRKEAKTCENREITLEENCNNVVQCSGGMKINQEVRR
jgi:hypothetical protein